MKTINQKNKWSKRFALVACKSVSCFLIVGLLFLTSCNSSSDPVSSNGENNNGEDPYVITENDFRIKTGFLTKEAGYSDPNYGTITLNSAKQFKFDIKDLKKDGKSFPNVVADSNSEEKIITVVNDNGSWQIKVKTGLEEGEYSFKLLVEGDSENGYSGKIEKELRLDIVPDEGKEDIDSSKISFLYKEAGGSYALGRIVIFRQKNYETGDIIRINYADPNYKSGLNVKIVDVAGRDLESFTSKLKIEQEFVFLSEDLPVGEYQFKLEFSGDKYNGKYQTEFFKLEIEELEVKGRYRFSTKRTEAMFGDDVEYGKIELNEGVTANFSISENIPGRGVNVDQEGNITIAQGVPSGIHTFKVKITGTGEYARGGSVEESYVVEIIPAPINTTNFAINYQYITREKGYELNESFWKITLREGVTGSFSIEEKNSIYDLGADEVEVSENGDIALKKQLDEGKYYFTVRITLDDQGPESSFLAGFTLNVIQSEGTKLLYENEFNFNTNVTPFDTSSPIILEEGYRDNETLGKFRPKDLSLMPQLLRTTYTVINSPKIESADIITVSTTFKEMQIKQDLKVGDYKFYVEAEQNDSLTVKFRQVFWLSVVPKKE